MFKKSRQIYFLCYILTYKWRFEYIPLLNICFCNTFINQQAKLTQSLWNRMNHKVWWHLSSPLKCIFLILSVENELNMREFWKICRDFDLIFGDECSVMAVVYLELARCFSYQDGCRESYYFENAKYHKIILLGHKNQELIENVHSTPTQFLEGKFFKTQIWSHAQKMAVYQF